MRRPFLLLCGATFFHFGSLGIFLAALPLFITGELQRSRATVGLTLGAFSVTALLLRPVVGRFVDRVGRRPFLAAAPALIVVTSLGLLAATNLAAVVVLRLVQGVAGGFFYTAAAAVATDLAPADKRGEYIARFSLFLYAGFALGPSAAEWVVSRYGFTEVWLAAAAAGALALVCAIVLPESLPARPTGPAPRWRFLHPAAIGPGFVLFTAAVGYISITTFSPLYARYIGMESSGQLYIAFSVTVIGVRLFSGRLADVRGPMVAAFPGLALGFVGMGLLGLTPGAALATVGVMAFGAGFALLFPALMMLAVSRTSDAERGEVLGSTVAFFDVGALAGGYAVGAIADRAGFGLAFFTPGVLCLVGAVILLSLHRRARAAGRLEDTDSPLPEPAGT